MPDQQRLNAGTGQPLVRPTVTETHLELSLLADLASSAFPSEVTSMQQAKTSGPIHSTYFQDHNHRVMHVLFNANASILCTGHMQQLE